MITYCIIIAVGCFLSGIAIGAMVERKSWTCRAIPNSSGTAHYCDGKFYYIIEEHYFVTQYKRVIALTQENNPPQGGSGTTPPSTKAKKGQQNESSSDT